MSSDSLTIAADSLGKKYDIYSRPADRLRQMLLPRTNRLLGRGGHNYFEEFWALRDVSFTIARGETVGIIGRNGSGKSTLLQMICGTLHPSEGKVETHGRIAALLELGAGFNPEFTGEENVFLSGLLYGIPEKELRKRFQSILDFADIGKFINQPVKTYSSGMYVRLAFSIAAHVDADVLVIDEALSVGDVVFTQKCMRFLRDFQSRGTLIFVSHDTSAVTNLCSRALWLNQGHLVLDGTAKDVVESYLAAQHVADRAAIGETVSVHVAPPVSVRSFASDPLSQNTAAAFSLVPEDVVDPRQEVLNGNGRRNLVAIFEFQALHRDSDFGAGAARITDVRLEDESGRGRKLIEGGESVDLIVQVVAIRALDAPIIGFHVKDRLGQKLFGDNTYLTYCETPLHVDVGTALSAHFRFRMPVLPNGDYSIDAAVATGTQENHTQQHWARDVLAFRASQSTMRQGLVGIPMHDIKIESEKPKL
ncbi:MAG: ABC transporter ATP-binding protein [Herbaspirillum sp.]